MAAAYLRACFGPGSTLPAAAGALARRQGERWVQLGALLDAGVNAPPTTSAGRLFDAVAALVGLRDRVNYEGQAAIELEQCAWQAVGETTGYPARSDGVLLRGTDLVRGVLDDLTAGAPVPTIAARFHLGLAELLGRAAEAAREVTGLAEVALSGGVFQNEFLLLALSDRLTTAGFTVLTHHQVPPNDAGISIGQVAVAGALDQAGRLGPAH